MAEHVCRNCSTTLDSTVSYCEQCGENNPFYIKQKKEHQADNKTSFNSSTSSFSHTTYVKQEGNGTGWFILGFVFPIAGIIMYFIFQQNKPLAANRSITGAVIGIFINMFFFF
jgi:hypothetical protein